MDFHYYPRRECLGKVYCCAPITGRTAEVQLQGGSSYIIVTPFCLDNIVRVQKTEDHPLQEFMICKVIVGKNVKTAFKQHIRCQSKYQMEGWLAVR